MGVDAHTQELFFEMNRGSGEPTIAAVCLVFRFEMVLTNSTKQNLSVCWNYAERACLNTC
jgi:hypothetical protein